MSDPVYDIIQVFKALFKQHESDTILSKLRSIFNSDAISEVFTYFCLHGASTAWVIQCRLEMTEPTAYRAMKHLKSLDIIVPALKATHMKRSKGGPRPTVWAIEDASADEVAEALKVHYQMLSPKYKIAEKVAQKILDEIHETGRPLEINYSDIMDQVKELKSSFTTPDITDLATQYLQEKGIKVWR